MSAYYFRPMSIHPVAFALMSWFSVHKRDLPWRQTKDPYFIWLSEIILQQTRVAQGLPYYKRFAETYPSVDKLAAAPEQEVLKLWQGLGYYNRARNLLETARIITRQFHCSFPKSSEQLIKLKGVGDYTAAAIASFAFDEVVPVLDGNAIRVGARLMALSIPANSATGKSEIRQFLRGIIPPENPALFNQAIMEFGALFCLPDKPDCQVCPLLFHCSSFKDGKVAEIPYKTSSPNKQTRYLNYFFVRDYKGKSLYRKRLSVDIWQGLFEPILIETAQVTDPHEVLERFCKMIAKNSAISQIDGPFIKQHMLTHRHIFANGYKIGVDKLPRFDGYNPYTDEEIEKLPVSRLIELLRNDDPKP